MPDYTGLTAAAAKLIAAETAPLRAALTAERAAFAAYRAAHPDTGTPTPDPGPGPTPPAPPGSGGGIWLNAAEVARISTSGAAWGRLTAAANGSWGSPNLADNNSNHDVLTLAGAIYAARTGDGAMRTRVAASLASVANATGRARVLEMSRQVPAYVFSADLIGFEDAKFDAFLVGLLTESLTGHSGGGNMIETALRSGNNWGAMSRAACAAIAVRTGRADVLRQVADAHRAWCGEDVPNRLSYGSTAWHASSPKCGINRRGATKDGHNFDGVIPEDQRRTETGDGYTWGKQGSYPWECLQGAVTTGVLLHRAKAAPFNCGDDALVRAAKWLTYENDNPAVGDDTWLPWLLNYYGNAGLPTVSANPGKNGGWTDVTHAP